MKQVTAVTLTPARISHSVAPQMVQALLWLAAILYAVRAKNVLDTLIGRKTRIRPVHHAYVAMTYDPAKDAFTSSKDTETSLAEIKINRDGEQYVLSSGGAWLCTRGDVLRKCANPARFEIVERPVGFRIKHRDDCLTIGYTYGFDHCSNDDTAQDFILEVDKDLLCNTAVEIGGVKVNLSKTPNMKEIDEKKLKKTMEKLEKADPAAKKAIKKFWKARNWNWKKMRWGLC